MFSKSVGEITTADLQGLLDDKAVENVRLEFKSVAPSKNELLKKLTSFANTFGGDLIVGVEESNEGVIKSIPGIDPQSDYRQKVTQWCFDGASPPLSVEVSDSIVSPEDEEKVCYVLRISESESAPYFINGRKGIFVRTNEQSQKFEAKLATQPELLALLDWRRSIVERRAQLVQRASQRFKSFVDTRYSELGSSDEGLGANFELSIAPRFPAVQVLSRSAAYELAATKAIPWRQVGFPRQGIGTVSQNESAIVLRAGSNFSIFELNIWGLMFYATEIQDAKDQWSGIHLYQFLGQLLVFLHHSKFLMEVINLNSDLIVSLKFDRILGIPWVYAESNSAMKGGSSPLDDSFYISMDTSTQDMCNDPNAIASSLLKQILFAMNWPDLVAEGSEQEELLRMAYKFNFWTWPPDKT